MINSNCDIFNKNQQSYFSDTIHFWHHCNFIILALQTNKKLRDIGTNIALAIQAYTELEPFIENNQSFFVPTGQQMLDLSAAPILFHLQSDIELMEYIKGCDNNVDNLDAKRVC